MLGLDAETRNMLGQTLERFLAEHYEPAHRLARLHGHAVDYRLNWPLLAELGVFALPFAAEHGGMDAAAIDVAHVLQVLASGLVLEPVAEQLVASALLASGPPDLAQEVVEAALEGRRISVVAGLSNRGLRVAQEGQQLRLEGTVNVVPFGAQADEWLVVAYTSANEARILRVPVKAPGVRVVNFRLMDGRPAADLHFDGVALDIGAECMPVDATQAALDRTGEAWLLARSADAVGVMDYTLRLTREYLRTRIQFGVAIGTFQALQHRLADMQMVFLEARALLRSWAAALDSNDEIRKAPLRRALPRVISSAGRRIGQEAIQLHGGMGVTEELVISHCNARLQVTATLLQDWLNHAEQLAWEMA